MQLDGANAVAPQPTLVASMGRNEAAVQLDYIGKRSSLAADTCGADLQGIIRSD